VNGLKSVLRLIAARAGVDIVRAERTFDACMAAVEHSAWPEVAWRFSRLTADGNPVEFSFSSASSGLRYTVEVGGPEMPEERRIEAACAILEQLGHRGPPADVLEDWRAMQASHSLRWGCWLGIRHQGNSEKSKLYIEVPPDAKISVGCLALPGSRLVMIGYESGTGRLEYYFRKQPLGIGDLKLLSDTAIGALEELYNMPIATALEFSSPAYSVSGLNGASQIAFFVRAGWIGGSAAARRQLLRCESSGGALDAYQKLVGRFRDDDLPDHGVLTLGLNHQEGSDKNVDLRAGLSGRALMRFV
jgi:hypothetical protein